MISKFEKDAILIAALAVFYVLESFVPYFDSYQNRTRHTARNLGLILLNAGILSVTITPLVVFATNMDWGFFALWDIDWWVQLGATILILDFVTYVLHVLYHKIPVMWRFHRVHHSDVAMGVLTGARFHIGEHLLSNLIKCGFYVGFAIELEHLLVYEAIFITNVFFHHANISIGEPLDRFYRILFTSPNMHKVHHSDIKAETDSNYTSLFSFWDRLFKTFRVVENPKRIIYGIKGLEDEQTVRQMLTTPFRDIKTE